MPYKDKEKEKETRARYYRENKELIYERRRNNEKRRAYEKEYYELNKDRINADRNTKFDCPCGGKYSKRWPAGHMQTQKHLKWLEENEISEKMNKTTNTEDTIK